MIHKFPMMEARELTISMLTRLMIKFTANYLGVPLEFGGEAVLPPEANKIQRSVEIFLTPEDMKKPFDDFGEHVLLPIAATLAGNCADARTTFDLPCPASPDETEHLARHRFNGLSMRGMMRDHTKIDPAGTRQPEYGKLLKFDVFYEARV